VVRACVGACDAMRCDACESFPLSPTRWCMRALQCVRPPPSGLLDFEDLIGACACVSVRLGFVHTDRPVTALAIHHSSPAEELPAAHAICVWHAPPADTSASLRPSMSAATCGAAPPTDDKKPRESVWYDILGILVELLTWSCVLPPRKITPKPTRLIRRRRLNRQSNTTACAEGVIPERVDRVHRREGKRKGKATSKCIRCSVNTNAPASNIGRCKFRVRHGSSRVGAEGTSKAIEALLRLRRLASG
jgi:hypothetical protein